MALHSIRVHALVAVLSTAMCGCSMVGLGYRAGHTRGSGKSEAARLTQLAELYERQGHPAGAMRLYRQAIHADPRSHQARERLMALSSQQGASTPAPGQPAGPIPGAAPMLAGTGAAPRSTVPSPRPNPRQAVAAKPAQRPQTVVPQTPAAPRTTPSVAARPSPAAQHRASSTSVAKSAAAAAAAVAATPIARTQAPVPDQLPVVEAAPAPLQVASTRSASPPLAPEPPVALPQEVHDAPATLTVELLPPPTLPELAVVQPAPNVPDTGWTTTRSQPVVQTPIQLNVPADADVQIRPQAVVEIPGLVQVPTAEWAPTDLKRFCPTASEELLSVVRRLESPDIADRKDALFELAEMGEAARPVENAVRSVLDDPNPSVRAHAAWATCRISGVSEDCVQTLCEVVTSGDPAGAAFAAYCLGLFEHEAVSAVPVLEAACANDEVTVRLCAAEALLRITPESAEPVAILIDELRNPDEQQRWLAALSLSAASNTYQDAAILALTPALSDAETDVCSSAALALGAYGARAQGAIPELQHALSNPSADVREAAAAALDCIVE